MRTPHGRMNCIPWGVFSRLDRSTQGEAPVSHAVLPVGRGPPSICGPRGRYGRQGRVLIVPWGRFRVIGKKKPAAPVARRAGI